MAEKTEKPTEKRRKEGKKEGQVVKSVEITSGVQLVTILLFFHFFTERLLQSVSALLLLPMELINRPFGYAMSVVSAALVREGALMLGIFFGMLAVATIGSIVLQIGVVLASKAIGFKGSKLDPVKNIKQIFSMNSVVELIKSSLKVTLLCLIFAYLFYFYAATFRALPYCGLHCALPVFSTFLRWMWCALMGFYVLLGVLDYAFQYHKLLKQQRMSKEDIKREYKDTDGDPHTKRRQRELQREIQSGSLARNVRQSAVVVRNPTHIAVCLGYHPTNMPVPRVLEKGTDGLAEQIILLANREAVAVVENVDLARMLYREVRCGETIPESMFEPVAALLRLVLDIDYVVHAKKEDQ